MFKLVVLVSLVSVALSGYVVPGGYPQPAIVVPVYLPVYLPVFYPYPRRHRHRHHRHFDSSSSSSSSSESHSHEKIRCKSCKKLTANCNNIADVELCREPKISFVKKYGCAHAVVNCPTDAEYFLIHSQNASNVLLFGKANDVFAKCNKGESWSINGTTVNNVACIVAKNSRFSLLNINKKKGKPPGGCVNNRLFVDTTDRPIFAIYGLDRWKKNKKVEMWKTYNNSEHSEYLFFSGVTSLPPTTTSSAHSTTIELVITSTTTSTSIASTTTVVPIVCGENANPVGSGCECVTGFTDILDTTLPDRANYPERGMKCISNDPCKTVAEPFTIIFVIDSSASIGTDNWGPLLSFLELAAPLLPKTSRVGFVKYAKVVSAKLMLSDNWTVEEFINKIPRIFDNYSTFTDLGLTAAADLLQGDPNNKRNVVLFTDGTPTNPAGMPPALALLKSVNAKLRVMGFGPGLTAGEASIRSWLDNPQEDYFPFYESPQNLTSAHMNSILTPVCQA